MTRKHLSFAALCTMLLVSACNGQLVFERVITATPDPNLIVVTVTPADGSAEAPTAAVAVAATPTPTPAALEATTPPPPPPTITPIAGKPTLSPFPTETKQEIYIAQQSFEKGYMIWIQARKIVWVLIQNPSNPNVGLWYVYQDSFDETVDQEDGSIVAPDGKFVPRRGFGKLWRLTPGLREALGWAITPEFALNTEYKYQPGGFLDQDNRYIPGPGTHFITTLYREVFALSEPDPAKPGSEPTWQRVN
jgi:hypothetical protein